MTDADNGHMEVLLPTASIALFTMDAKTKEAYVALSEDWRYARVNLKSYEGNVDSAIKLYGSEKSPDLMIIQTDTIDDGFTAKLEALAGNCAEGTAAIVVGPVNDVNLYRKLVGMGVSDYLVRPLETKQLGNDIAKTLLEQLGASDSRLIAVIGSKGGVGTTVIAENMAWVSAEHLKQKTFLMDASGGWSSLNVGIDFEPSTTLAEAARAAVDGNEDSLTRMLVSPSDKLTVLSSGGDVMLDDGPDAESYEELINYVMETHPVVIVDLSASPANLRRVVLSRAHQINIITSATLPSVRAARTIKQELKELRGGSSDNVEVILNMSGFGSKSEVPKTQIEEGLEVKVSAEFSYEPGLFVKNEAEANKIVDDKSASKVVTSLTAILNKILNIAGAESAGNSENDNKDSSAIGGFLNKLKSKS